MPTVNIFLPPLLGGFLLVSLWYPLRYWIQRQEGYRLIFAASIAGGFLLFIAQLLLFFFDDTAFTKPILAWWQSFLPVRNSAVGVLAFLLSIVFWGCLELFCRLIPAFRPKAIRRRYINASGDAFEQMLFRALETQEAVSVTLSTNKVYVGRVNTSFNLVRGVESIRLRLEKSGYRDAETHELTLNIDYAQTHQDISERLNKVYEQIIQNVMKEQPDATQAKIVRLVYERSESDAEIRSLAHNFEVVIMASEIVSVAPFDPELFKSYFEKRAKKP